MEDPVYTLPFFKKIIQKRSNDIIGLAVASGGRLKIGKERSKTVYLISLFLIMGIPHFLKYAWITFSFKIQKKFSAFFPFISSPSIASFAKSFNIPVHTINSPNNKNVLEMLRQLKPDIIINQSQYIIKKELLEIPAIGVLNRHNALLPKNRGRLTPFWVKYKNENKTGVSIHFVDEGIDSGPIVVQKSFPVTEKDTFNTIVKKNYGIAADAMLEALNKLEKGFSDFFPNEDSKATYNTVPTLNQAMEYRKKQTLNFFLPKK